jgi:hypothetical protein
VSLLLAAPGFMGVEPAEAGRWLTGLLFGANILLMGHVLAHATRNSVIAAWTGGALMLLSPDLFEVHTWIWSEPLFILLSLAGCALLAAFLERPSAGGCWPWLSPAWLASPTAGAALPRRMGLWASPGFHRSGGGLRPQQDSDSSRSGRWHCGCCAVT